MKVGEKRERQSGGKTDEYKRRQQHTQRMGKERCRETERGSYEKRGLRGGGGVGKRSDCSLFDFCLEVSGC